MAARHGQLATSVGCALMMGCALGLGAAGAWGQDSGSEGTLMRGEKGEIAITVHDNSGAIISVPATVRVMHAGGMVGQSGTTEGRAFFVVGSLGDYTVSVEASGYKTQSKEVSVLAAVRVEADVYLQLDTSGASGSPGAPILAPKAKELLDRGVKALSENKLDAAQKYIDETLRLAPANPEVLYVDGVLCLRKRDYAQAQAVLEKATQVGPTNAQAWGALGMALTNEGKFQASIEPLERALQLNPKVGYQTQWALGKAYYQNGQYPEALKVSQEALTEANGKEPEIKLLVAEALTAAGRYEDAAAMLRDFLKENGNDPQAATAKRWLARLTKDGKIKAE